MKLVLAAILIVGLGACGSMSDTRVSIDVDRIAARAPDLPPRAQVEVIDIRKQARLERTTGIGDVSMGRVTLDPPEAVLVRRIMAAKADLLLATLPATQTLPVIRCGIRMFDIVTPGTALYWDVTARIELVLRVAGKDRTVSGLAVERTYVWPSEEIIDRVTQEALRQVADATGRALPELLGVASR